MRLDGLPLLSRVPHTEDFDRLRTESVNQNIRSKNHELTGPGGQAATSTLWKFSQAAAGPIQRLDKLNGRRRVEAANVAVNGGDVAHRFGSP